MEAAGIVVAGGQSAHLGTPRSDQRWAGPALVQRTAALLRSVVSGPVVVVGAPGQELPDLPEGVEVGVDAMPGRGPLEGLATGLHVVADRASVAFLAAADMPLLHAAFVRRVLAELADPEVDVALPFVRGYRQSLAAGYRTSVLPLLDDLLAAGQRWPSAMFEHCRIKALHEPDLLADPALAAADPHLDSVLNLSDPDAYAAALARYGTGLS